MQSRSTVRGDANAHELIAPGTLADVLHVLASAPETWTPIAGGTEIMVAHAAGRLAPGKLISLWGVPELRFIKAASETIIIGAGCTFTDLRRNPDIGRDLPLLALASSWIGSIANQNRATLGGNLVNGSPAADSSPALLVYDAELELMSVRGSRRIRYADFHTGYKRNALEPDELLFAVHLPRRFAQHATYLRKVGTRRAMAISKVALGATALLTKGVISEVRIAAASLAAYPTRLFRTEETLMGQHVNESVINAAQSALLGEIVPIDDIRSTAGYRSRVATNLLREFLLQLRSREGVV